MTTRTNNPYFQVGLDVFGQRCLVLGGQDEAADKITRLVAAGANVVVFSPNVSPAISAAAQRGELAW
ncbi:MAG: uroporphyrinogen-III C-methyltransferase, partial [Gemmatimonadetes bacterium]|nr:uroporphyrinogen-III C-methyltransferase [Gemmatimonadota bacterium]